MSKNDPVTRELSEAGLAARELSRLVAKVLWLLCSCPVFSGCEKTVCFVWVYVQGCVLCYCEKERMSSVVVVFLGGGGKVA